MKELQPRRATDKLRYSAIVFWRSMEFKYSPYNLPWRPKGE